MEIYVVKPGDSVDSIAQQLDANAEQIIFDNQLEYPYPLAVGQALLINRFVRNASRAITVSGYAYPFIDREVLVQTLPYLSELRVFSYGFTMEGELLPPSYGDDSRMIAQALQFGTQPILTLTPFGEDGNFNNQLINSVVNNTAYTERLIRELLETMDAKVTKGWISILNTFWHRTGMPFLLLYGRWRKPCAPPDTILPLRWRLRQVPDRQGCYMRERITGHWGRLQTMYC